MKKPAIIALQPAAIRWLAAGEAGSLGGHQCQAVMVVGWLFLSACAAAGATSKMYRTNIVSFGAVELSVEVPRGFHFEPLTDSFRLKRVPARSGNETMYVFVTPSELVLQPPMPGGKRVTLPLGGIPTRWWMYDLGATPLGRLHRFGDLLSIAPCESLVRIGVQIFGNDAKRIDALTGVAERMRITSPCKLAGADAVAKEASAGDQP